MNDESFDPAGAPEGFTLEAEASRQDEAATTGITERDAVEEPDDDALDPEDESGDADDDEEVDDEDDDAPVEDV